MLPISITGARPEHLAAIPAIELACARLFAESDLPRNIRYRVTDKADLRHALDDGRLWVALHERQPVGFAMSDVLDGEAHLDELDVLPEFGRRGIGTRLTRHVINWAADEGFRTLSLLTFRHLPWNAPFYEKLGFEPIGVEQHGPELASLLEEEGRLGIDIGKRVAMRLEL